MQGHAAIPQDLFEDYFHLVENTEPPLIFHRWSLICCIAALLGRQAWIPFGSFRIFPNQYVMLIGEPGTRKSTAIKMSKKVLSASGYAEFAAEKTTKEKFLIDLEGRENDQAEDRVTATQVMENLFGSNLGDTEARETFIIADEFNDFMRCGDLEFHSMLGALWDYDDETSTYKQRLKNSRSISIYQPTINILGGNTHVGFNEMFPPQALGQGFLSRLLLIYSEPSGKKFAFPEPPDEKRRQKVIAGLQKIGKEFVGALTLQPKAKEVLHILYNNYQGFEDMRFTSYFTRRYTHLLKLCIICCAARVGKQIEVKDVLYANTILRYAEHYMPKALGEFGKAKNSDVAAKILQLLSKTYTPVGLTGASGLWKQVSSDLDRVEDLQKMLTGLHEAGKIQYIQRTERGEGGWMIVRRAMKSNELYVDFNLLREHQEAKIR